MESISNRRLYSNTKKCKTGFLGQKLEIMSTSRSTNSTIRRTISRRLVRKNEFVHWLQCIHKTVNDCVWFHRVTCCCGNTRICETYINVNKIGKMFLNVNLLLLKNCSNLDLLTYSLYESRYTHTHIYILQ